MMHRMYPNSRFVFVLALVSLIAAGQESRPAPAVKLPVTDQARPGADGEAIKLWVLRNTETAASETRPKSREREWRVQVERQSHSLDKDGMVKLQAALTKLADEKLSAKEPKVSERTLLIAADAGAPYGLVQRVLGAAALARLHKVEIATSSGSLMTPLPLDGEALARESRTGALEPVGEIKVLLAWNSAASKVERLFGSDTAVPPNSAGDRKLEELIKADLEKLRKTGTSDVHVLIDSGPGVPWQTIVDVMTIARRAGVERIEHAAPH